MYFKHLKKEDKEFVFKCVENHELPLQAITITVSDKVNPYNIEDGTIKYIPHHSEILEDEDEWEYTVNDKLIYLSIGDIAVDLSVKEAIALQKMIQFEIENVFA